MKSACRTLNWNPAPMVKLFQQTPLRCNDLFKMILIRAKTNQATPRPRRIYLPHEKLPEPAKKRTLPAKPEVLEKEKNSTSIFNAAMGEIHKNRDRKKIALEGTRLIEEALLAGLRLEKLFLLKSLKDIPPMIAKIMEDDKSLEVHRVAQKQLQVWTSVTTPPGLIGIFPKPKPVAPTDSDKLPLILICDNLREPGNLGSILRSAAGVGCKMILLSKGCVDPWDAKVLRSGSGAHFHVPIQTELQLEDLWTTLEVTQTRSNSAFGATDHGLKGSLDYPVGNNQSLSLKPSAIFFADSNVESPDSIGSKIPSVSYLDVDYTKFERISLVLGGETEGLKKSTFETILGRQALERKFSTISRLHIPLKNRIESLNVANAFGIIAFEMSRQFREMKS